MDVTMKSLPTQAIFGAGVAALAATIAATAVAVPLAVALVVAAAVAAVLHVTFVAQSRRLRDEERLVYRPVYVRRHDVQRRIRADD